MAYKTRYLPENASKYIGNPTKIIFRSLWERKVCKWMDFNKNVLRWGSEELVVPYISPKDNKPHKYFPDFIAEVKNNDDEIETLVIEVKPKKQTMKPAIKKSTNKNFIRESITFEINTSKWKAAENFCKNKGWKFVILTEEHIFPKSK